MANLFSMVCKTLILMIVCATGLFAIEWTWTGAVSTAFQAQFAERSGAPWLQHGNPISRAAGLKDLEFELEHVHLAIGADLNERLSFSVAPCIEHEGSLSIRMAYLEANILEKDFETILSSEVGRFLVPFGRFNYLAEVTNYPTISRPMMFASHDQDIIIFPGFPHPLFMSQYSEIGINLNGNKWFRDKHQLWYAVWVGNGMYQEGFTGHQHGGLVAGIKSLGKVRAVQEEGHDAGHGTAGSIVGTYNGQQISPASISWLQKTRFSTDNNGDKALGGRLSYGYKEILSVGASYMQGKYDPDEILPYSALGADGSMDLKTGIGTLNISGEFIHAPISFAALNDTATKRINIGEYTLLGYYGQLLFSFAKKWELVGIYDLLQRSGPETRTVNGTVLLEDGAEDEITRIHKFAGGLNFSVSEQAKIKTEYALYQLRRQFTMEQPDNIHRLSSAVVVSF